MDTDIRLRVWVRAGEIDYDTFRLNKPLSTQEDPTSYKDYERAACHEIGRGKVIHGERERLINARKRLDNKNLWLKDYSGTYPGVGNGGIDEIVVDLEREQHLGRRPVLVIVDYAGIAVTNYINAHPQVRMEEWQMLNNYINDIRRKVAIPYNCSVWVLHQLHGDETRKGPTARQHHSRMRGARNFADNAAFAFVMGNLDPQTSALQIECTKHRRAAASNEPAIFVLDGRVAHFKPANETYAVSSRACGGFANKADRGVIVAPGVQVATPGTPGSSFSGFVNTQGPYDGSRVTGPEDV